MKAYNLTEHQLKSVISNTSARLYKDAFVSRSAITGEEILEFCSHKQINKFILFQIYQEWNLYSSKLSHPYFDFHHNEVRAALQQFQNVLSQHIRVERKDFKALVDKAAYNTVKLILNPVETFSNFFFMNKEKLSIQYFERYAHYFSDFDFIVNSILQHHKKEGLEEVDKRDFMRKMEKIVRLYEEKSGHSIDNYRSIIFHKLTGEEIGKLLEDAEGARPAQREAFSENTGTETRGEPQYAEAARPAEHEQYLAEAESLVKDLYSSAEDKSYASEPPEPRPAPNQRAKPAESRHEQPAETNGAAETPVQTPGPEPEVSPKPETEEEKPATLAEQFARRKQQSGGGSSYSDPAAKGGEIKIEQIPMHKQFQYVQKVFAGDREKFKRVIGALNQCENWDAADEYLRTHILNMPEVNREDEVTREFIAFVKTKK